MKMFYRISVLLSVAFLVLFSAGCDPDTPGGGGGGVTLPPEITLNSGTGTISFNQELPLNTASFIVNVSGNDGDALLGNMVIQENGITIPPSSLVFRTGQTSNNPILITGGDTGGFTYEIEITPGVTSAGDATYSFRLTDVDGEVATTEVTITYISNPPTIDLLVEDGFVSGNTTISTISTDFSVRLQYSATEDSVRTVEVLEGGSLMDAARLTYFSPDFTASNPLTLLPSESQGATFNIRVSPDGAANSTRTYTFRVTDATGASSEQVVSVFFDTPAGTVITLDTVGVFFNASGVSGGGLDLDNGTTTTFNSGDAEIQDEGIDLDSGGENWRAQISSVNDAVVKVADFSVLGDGANFSSVSTEEEIALIFDGGGALAGDDNFPDADGDQSADEDVSLTIQEGDVFVVRRGDRTYLVRFDTVSFVASSNDDSYSVSIKY
jgi:hypothetical protein